MNGHTRSFARTKDKPEKASGAGRRRRLLRSLKRLLARPRPAFTDAGRI